MLTLSLIREIQFKIRLRYNSLLTRMPMIKKIQCIEFVQIWGDILLMGI